MNSGSRHSMPSIFQVAAACSVAIGSSATLNASNPIPLERRGFEISRVPNASASRAFPASGLSGGCWLGCGAQPDSQTVSNVARLRPSD